jgi:LPXTG-motif cell wall-anchored protein
MDEEEPDLLLLHGSDTGADSSYLLAGVLTAAGIGLIYLSKKKKDEKQEGKKEKKESKELPEAEANQVVFSADASQYKVGPSWTTMTLEPYLEEKVEETILATPEWKEKGAIGWGMTKESLEASMDSTREKVLSAFSILTFVKVGKGQKTIAVLPDTQAVRNFKSMLRAHTKKFQEEY